jgi:hypothetical protein
LEVRENIFYELVPDILENNGIGYFLDYKMTFSEVMVELLNILKKEAELLKDCSLFLLQDGSEEGSKIEIELKDSEIISECNFFFFFFLLFFIFN